jgi:DNA-binding MarR family transcriptional regulator
MNKEVLLNLKKAVNFAEAGLELQNLTLLEKEMYYGVLTIVDQNNEFSSDLLKDTVKVLDIPHATYHRMIKNLLKKGFISKAANRRRNSYVLVKTV